MPNYSGSISYGGGGNLKGVQTGPSPGITIGGQEGAFQDPFSFIRRLMALKDRRASVQRSRPLLETHNAQSALQDQLLAEQVKQAKIATQEAEAQRAARMGPMPTRTMFGFNVIPGRVADPNAMNYYQRQAYLPQNAGISGGYGPGASLEAGPALHRPGGWGTGGTNWQGDPAATQQLNAGQQAAAFASDAGFNAARARMYPGMWGRMQAAADPRQYLPENLQNQPQKTTTTASKE